MASLKDVYELIHSLEKREKIQFNLYANALSGKAKESYISDYQCFVNEKTYNKALLKQALNKVKKRKNLSESNTNLYNCILDSLLGTYKNKLKKVGLLKEIQNIEILFEKGLIEQAEQLLLKLKQKLEQYGNPGLLLYLSDIENQLLLHRTQTHNDYDQRIALIDKQLKLLKSTETKLQFRKLKRQLFDLAGKIGTPRTNEHLSHYLDLKDSNALEIEFRLLPPNSYADYYIVKYMLFMVINPKELIKGVSILKEGIQLLQSEIDIKQDFVPEFLLTRMYMQSAVMASDEKDAKESIKAFEKLQPFLDTNHHQILSKTALQASNLLYCLNFNKIKIGYKYLLTNKEAIIDPNNLSLSPHAYTNYLACARICFLSNDYSLSIEFIDLLLAMKDEIRKAIVPHVYGLHLMNHYKMDNTVYLPYAIRSFYKSILKSEQLYEPEKALLSFLKKTVNLLDLQVELRKLYKKLKSLDGDPFHVSLFNNSDYLIWLKNEIEE